ncbi:MAG: hypothetical protein K6B74_09510 [Ruminococcus sp.]|nr:hypothetical protein [Ruminococcus sp.]
MSISVYDTSIPYDAEEDLPIVEAIVDAMLENDEEYNGINDPDYRMEYRNERIAEVQASRSAKGCKILIPGDEYRIIANNTAISGTFNIRLVGMGNYKLARTETWNALTAEQANESYNKIKEVTNVEIYNFKATETTTAIPRVTLTLKRSVKKNSGISMVETGILYVQDMENTTPLTIENAAKGLVHKKSGTSVNGSGVYNIGDGTGKGVRVVGYVTASYGDYTTTIYTDEVKTSYAEQKAIKAIKDATSISLSDPSATINPNSGKERVTITQTRKVAEGFTIVETGFLFVKDKSSTIPLTIGNVGVDGVTKNCHVNSNGSKTLHITDPDQKGVRVVGFATVTDGVYTTTIYTREVATSYAELSAQ